MGQTEWESNSKNQSRSIKSIEPIRQYHHIAWNAEGIQRIRAQKFQRLKIRK